MVDPEGQASRVAGFLHPGRNVALPVQHTPDVDVVGALDVEDQIGIPGQRPRAQAWKVQLVGVARRARARMAAYVRIGSLQGTDEAQRCSPGIFRQVVCERILDVPMGLLARDNGPGPHGWRRVLPVTLAGPRTRSRKPSK